ncbi:MAG: toluene monooxygenase [Sporichthyaceae bacterium]
MTEQAAETLKPLRTWSHLTENRKKPSEYEIVSVKTLFTTGDPDAALELSPDVPMNRWIKRYRTDSRLQHPDWDAFRDPDGVVYRTYCTQRDNDEDYVDGLVSQYNDMGHDAKLSPEWVAQLGALYTPMRYLLHTAQMAAAYLVTMSQASTVANCAVFQMSDQLRWVSRVSYRTAELRKSWPSAGFGAAERAHWENDPAWQGLRELMERLLSTYDYGEALLALNCVAMPAIDEALSELGARAAEQGDTLTQFLVEAQLADSQRRERWTQAFVAFVEAEPENKAYLAEVVERWTPLAEQAVANYRGGFAGA